MTRTVIRRTALATAVFLACGGVGATFAAFSDTTTSTGNSFSSAVTFLGFIKTVGTASCGGTSDIVTVPAGGVASGSTLVVRVALRGGSIGSFTPTVTDSKGNTYTLDVDEVQNSVRAVMFSAYVGTALAPGDTITLTHPSISASVMDVTEFTGVESAGRVDQTAANSGDSPNPTATVTTTNAYDLIVGAVASNQNDPVTQPGGWTPLATVDGDCGGAPAKVSVHGAYRIEAATGAFTYDPVLGATRQWADVIAAYKGG